MNLRRVSLATAVAFGLMSLPLIASAQSMSSPMLVQTTPHYTVTLTVGPAQEMISPTDAMHGATGEVMVNTMPSESGMGSSSSMSTGGASMGSSSSMSMNTMMDQGMAVNHHLEVHITQNGTVVDNVTPVIRVTDRASGEFRDLPDVMSMFDAQMGMSDFHYGQNVWMPDGTYNVDVMLGMDTASFRDVMVSGGSSMAMSPTSSMGSQSSMNASTGNALVASDGSTLAGQPADVQAMFNTVWGARAAAEWVTEHNALLMGMH